MDFTNLPIFNVMRNKMAYHSERQGVLAQNIANADTPGYQAQDVKEPNFKKMAADMAHPLHRSAMGGVTMARTDANHMAGNSNNKSGSYATVKRLSTYEHNPTGNNIVIEEEMSKVAANQGEYQKVLNLYRKSVDMFKLALGKPTG